MSDPDLKQFMAETRQILLDSSRTLGRLEKGQEGLNQHIGAVSANGKALEAKLEAHKEDDGAHGIKTMRNLIGGMVGLLTLVVTGIEFWHMVSK